MNQTKTRKQNSNFFYIRKILNGTCYVMLPFKTDSAEASMVPVAWGKKKTAAYAYCLRDNMVVSFMLSKWQPLRLNGVFLWATWFPLVQPAHGVLLGGRFLCWMASIESVEELPIHREKGAKNIVSDLIFHFSRIYRG